LVEKSVKKCSISVGLDGLENDFIWYSDDACMSCAAGVSNDEDESN
jgi:hypothetical protein